jgi:hypothetical protein
VANIFTEVFIKQLPKSKTLIGIKIHKKRQKLLFSIFFGTKGKTPKIPTDKVTQSSFQSTYYPGS